MRTTRPNPGVAAAGRRLRLVAGGAEPAPAPEPGPHFPFPLPDPPPEPGRPAPPPSVGARWAGIGVARARASVAGELAALRRRVADLEHANRRLAAAVEAARAEGERAVRTMAGRLPSILIGGRH